MRRPFGQRRDQPRLNGEEAARQGRATSLAFKLLGSTEAIAFMNAHDDQLDRRPIDLAIESDEGLAAVEKLLTARQSG
ncbi:MAG: antitoxin Xre/MbcA/ParS toxin-binding domain-containing protein [Sphingobium sp.]